MSAMGRFEGYGGVRSGSTRQCPTRRGSGINPVWMTRVCPKCDGERVVPIGGRRV